LLKPTLFKVGGRKYHLTDIMNIVSSELEINFFEFIIKNSDAYSPDKVLVFVDPEKQGSPRGWCWFIYLKKDDDRVSFSYHYKDLVLPEKDFFKFADYVRAKTPEALPYILFNYIV